MKPELRAYIAYRLDRARGALADATMLLNAGRLHSAVNRLYYACFYAVSALLLSEGRSSSKHTGVRAFFNQQWVKNGRVPAEMGEFYNALYDGRQEADYRDLAEFEPAEVQGWMDRATAFVAEMAKLVEQQLSKDGQPLPQ